MLYLDVRAMVVVVVVSSQPPLLCLSTPTRVAFSMGQPRSAALAPTPAPPHLRRRIAAARFTPTRRMFQGMRRVLGLAIAIAGLIPTSAAPGASSIILTASSAAVLFLFTLLRLRGRTFKHYALRLRCLVTPAHA